MNSDSDEHELLQLLATDVNVYFLIVVERYQKPLTAYAFHMVHHQQQVEDIIQDSFIKAYEALRGYSSLKIQMMRLRPWLFRIVHNCCLNYLMREKKAQGKMVSLSTSTGRTTFEETIQGVSMPLEMEVVSIEVRNELYSLISQLPDTLRAPFVLHYIVELPYSEIALILKMHPDTAKSYGRRGKHKVQEMLEKANPTEVEMKKNRELGEFHG